MTTAITEPQPERIKISLRSMYIAPPGKVLVAADLSQAESWIVAYLANEPSMKYLLYERDSHTDSAAAQFYPTNSCLHKWQKKEDGETRFCTKCAIEIVKSARYIGKRYNHASAYRMKYVRAAEVINTDSDKPPFVTVTLSESKMFQERWHARYNLKNWWADIENKLANSRTLTTVYGFRRTFFSQWGEELFKEATAFEPQSTVADHFNGAIHPELGIRGGLIEIYRQLVVPYKDHKIINQSHDSCMMEVPASSGVEIGQRMMALLKRPIVIKGEEFTIPTDGEIGERWGEMEPLKAAV